MFRALLTLPLLLAAVLPAMDVATIARRLERAATLDTAAFRVVSTSEMMGRTTRTTAQVVRAGQTRYRMEVEGTGTRLRMIREGERMRVVDLRTGSSHVQVVEGARDELSLARAAFREAAWRKPVSGGPAIWQLRGSIADSSGTRDLVLRYSAPLNQIVSLVRIGPGQDTTAWRFVWGRSGGRQVLRSIRVRSRLGGQVSTVRREFSQWKFPRTLPDSLFAVGTR